jgi:hypothetical protein
VWTIQPETSLPFLNHDSTVIDATTQTSDQGDRNPKGPEIEINGSGLTECGFEIYGSANIIKGFIINRCTVAGIIILKDRNTIMGNYIGTDATGSFALPNSVGIQIFSAAKHNTIGGNTDDERNLISGNHNWGIYIYGAGTDSNRITGNFIGTNAEGEDTLCNIHGGINLSSGSVATIIGGKTEGERNVISGCTSEEGSAIYSGNGITIRKSNSNIVIGNYIGTDKDGTTAMYNKKYGILIQECQYNKIGGTEPGEANVISGYGSGGIIIRMGGTQHNVVTGNFIGTGPKGPIPCEDCLTGIYFDYGAHDNTVGPGNIIADNLSVGVLSYLDSTIRNTITQNSITRNGESGITNADGANHALSTPIIAEVNSSGVTGTACAGCIVEIFSDSVNQGAIYEGYTIADASGNFAWSGMVTGPFVTATATDTAGNTS